MFFFSFLKSPLSSSFVKSSAALSSSSTSSSSSSTATASLTAAATTAATAWPWIVVSGTFLASILLFRRKILSITSPSSNVDGVFINDLITVDECQSILSLMEMADAGLLTSSPIPVQGQSLSTNVPISKRHANLGSDYTFYALVTEETAKIAKNIQTKLETKTGVSWKYGSAEVVVPLTKYEIGHRVHCHRDKDVDGWGPVTTVATISIAEDYEGGEIYVNRRAMVDAVSGDVTKEDVKHRKFFRIPFRGAILFHNDEVVHGTTEVTRGLRVTVTFRTSAYATF